MCQVAIGDGSANGAAGDDDTAENYRCHAIHFKAERAAQFAKRLNISGLPMAEAKVLSNDDNRSMECIGENAAHKIVGSERCNGVIEGQNKHGIQAK